MREIRTTDIARKIEELCIYANCHLNSDIRDALSSAREIEESATGCDILDKLLLNACIASDEDIPICQDTGMAVVFMEIGQDVHITGGNLREAVDEGVRVGYKKGWLRKSVVGDPLERRNTGDNTPAVIHYEIVPGDRMKVTVAPKGFGSENMSALKMLKPSDGVDGVRRFIVETVEQAGPNPCPPVIVGVGIGGTMEKAAIMSKKALLRPLGTGSIHVHIRELETQILNEINKTGIGPAGLGGRITALGVHIETFATHIAGLPVAVNMGCHATRHASVYL